MKSLFIALALSLLGCSWFACQTASSKQSLFSPPAHDAAFVKDKAYALFLMARALEESGRPLEAVALYEKVVEADTEAVAVVRILMEHALRRGQQEPALRYAKIIAREDSSDTFSLLYGQLLYRNREMQEALRVISRADGLHTNPYLLELSGLIFEQLGDTAKAESTWEKLHLQKPEEPLPKERLLSLYVGMGRWELALRTIKNYAATAPSYSSSFRFSLFRALDAAGYVDSVLPSLAMMASRFVDKERFAVLRDWAHLEVRKGRADRAESLYCVLQKESGSFQDRRALGLFLAARGKSASAESLLIPVVEEKQEAETAYYLGVTQLNLGKHTKAIQNFLEALIHDSTNPVIWLNLGVARLRSGQAYAAESAFVKASTLTPEESEPYFLCGLSQNAQQKYDAASRSFQKSWALDTTYTEALFQWATSLERSAQVPFARAESLLQEVLKRDSSHHAAMNYLAYSYVVRNQKLDIADSLLTRALERSPDNPAYWDSFGWLRFQQARFAEAYTHLEKALQLNKEDDPEILEHLALCAEALQLKEKGLGWWERLLKLLPNHPLAKSRLP